MTPVQAIGKFYDGKTGQPYEVMIGLTGSGIRISCTDSTFQLDWSFNEIQVLEDAVPPQPAKLTSIKDPDARLFINSDHGWIRIRDKLPRNSFPKLSLPDTWKSFIAYLGFTIAAIIVVVYAAPRFLENSSFIIPESMEKKMGRYVLEQIVTEQVCVTPEGKHALRKLVKRLENETKRGIDFKVYVVNDSDVLNAFAAPGAYLALFSGVIDRAETPEEVAGILAHEMAHIELYHPTKSLMRDMGLSMIINMMTGSADLGQLAGTLVKLSYSREDESDADRTGRKMLADANIDPKSMALFFQKILDQGIPMPEGQESTGESHEENEEESSDEKEQSVFDNRLAASALTYLSTHPQTKERIDESLQEDFDISRAKPILTAQEFENLKNICSETKGLE